eukprot:TRINITY_DN2383_c0_g1_i1.p1 TRINITY_DN2383_c0_g1~~TRINITY_DN2383_c0_g1_i1.p1  ORF type:complete len:876 (+),score=186.89 TRINITY_DN2383_c0_g1_i1:279-2630(+)
MWVSVPAESRLHIKQATFSCFSDEFGPIRSASSNVLSRIALIEIPNNLWGDAINILHDTIVAQNPNHLRQTCLETLGYICEDIDQNSLASSSHLILTAVIHGMRVEETDLHLKKVACRALYNALDFCAPNFAKKDEFDYIMNVILEATNSGSEEVVLEVLAILTEIANFHYEKLHGYIQRIFQLTMVGIKSESEDIGKLCIEFWCTICDVESYIIEELRMAEEDNRPCSLKCFFFINGVLEYLIPVLTEEMTKQEDQEFYDHDEYTLPMASSICLNLIAVTVEDNILQHVMPFIEQHINSENWRFKEAAILAFGCILEGPTKYIKDTIIKALPVLINHLQTSTDIAVKDTASWTIGNVVKNHPSTISKNVEDLLSIMCLVAKTDQPRVASNACWVIHNIALEFKKSLSNPFVKHFDEVAGTLLQVSDRNDANEANLRTGAYEALNVVVDCSPSNVRESLVRLMEEICMRLEKTFVFLEQGQDTNIVADLQSLLCGVLLILLRKLSHSAISYCDRVMNLMLAMCSGKTGHEVADDALLTIDCVIDLTEKEGFGPYLERTMPFLGAGLSNWKAPSVVLISVGIISNLTRSLKVEELVVYLQPIVSKLLENLNNPKIDRSVFPHIFSCIGDLSLACGGAFEPHIPEVVQVLHNATKHIVLNEHSDEPEFIDYVNSLRQGILEAFTGLLLGMQDAGKSQILLNADFIDPIDAIVKNIASDHNRTDEVSRTALGLVGDIARCFGSPVRETVNSGAVHSLLSIYSQPNYDEQSNEVARWTQKMIANTVS